MKHMEIECKWEANSPRAFYRATHTLENLCGFVTPHLLYIQDAYLDDAKQSLSKRKIALRVRNTDGIWEVTFKTRTEIKNGKAIRREETLPLPSVKNISQALHLLAQKKKWKDIPTAGLCVRFKLTNKRTVYLFNYDGAELEMVLDDVTLRVLGRQVKFKEIEIELKRGKLEKLEAFAELFTRETKLKHAKISKVKTADTLLKLWEN